MGYDPTDPNQGSQAPAPDQANPDAQASNATSTGTLNDRIRKNQAVAAWLAQHRDGQHLSKPEQGQLFYLIRAAGTDPTGLEITDDGLIQPAIYNHARRDTLIAAAEIYGGGLLGGYVAGLLGPAANEAWDASGNFIGQTTVSGVGEVTTPVLEGLAAGGGGAATTVPTVGAVATTPEAIQAAKDAGYTIDANGVVQDAASVPPDYGSPGTGFGGTGLTYADLLKYGLPTAGGLVSSIIQSNASSNASAAQTKYLEDALAYEKENDLYKRGVDAAAVAKEAQRYGDYQSRISPFIDNGISSNDRMSSLVGLPARSGATSGGAYSVGGGGSSGGGSPGVAITPQITQKILDNYKALGLTPSGSGSGPTDTAYFAQRYAETGGSTPDNDRYWFGPTGRIAKEARQAGVTFGTPGPTAPAPTSPTSPTPPASAPPAASAPPITGAPVQKSLVTVRWPDGSSLQVPPDQVESYRRGGATLA